MLNRNTLAVSLLLFLCLMGFQPFVFGQDASPQPTEGAEPQTDPLRPPVFPSPNQLPSQPTRFSSPSRRQASRRIRSKSLSSPNMFGDLLRGFRSVNFPYNGAGDFSPVISAGSLSLKNSSVAENNSAIPRTRFSLRYNHFKNATDVQGFRLSPETVPVDNFDFLDNGQPLTANIPLVFPATRSYDADFYTVAVEQTFLEDMASIEFRIPTATALDSSQHLIGARELLGTGAPPGATTFDDSINDIPVDIPPGAAPLLTPSGDVLGRIDTELQDVTGIFKGVLFETPRLVVSGGFGVTAPTARDVNITVVDTYDDDQGFEPFAVDPTLRPPFNTLPINVFDSATVGSATNFRRRDIRIENEIWNLAPFLAIAMTPTDRLFFNGFFQASVPLNSAHVSYRERRVDIVARDIFPNAVGINADGLVFGPNGSEGDFRQDGRINEQTLMQFNIGGGYWLYQDPRQPLITGIAGVAELHYTTTLEDADIIDFQPGPDLINSGLDDLEDPTRIGNLANRVDILNLTLGTVIQLGSSASFGVAYVTPLRDELDRTFDGEINVRLNLFR